MGKKILNEENSNQYPDISSMDDTDDENFVPETPQVKKLKICSILKPKSNSSSSAVKAKRRNQWVPPPLSPAEPLEENWKKVRKRTLDENTIIDNQDLAEKARTYYTVKRNWEGVCNYFWSSSKFDIYFPPGLNKLGTGDWMACVESQQNEIKIKGARIFEDKDVVILVCHRGRVRMCFPCPGNIVLS